MPLVFAVANALTLAVIFAEGTNKLNPLELLE